LLSIADRLLSTLCKMAPLQGIRVIELAGLAPGPFAGMLLADWGASVLRVDRPHPGAHSSSPPPPTNDILVRNKSSIAVDLKNTASKALLQDLLRNADVLIDPYRPGVLEKLGLGPDVLLEANPRLIIARMTGFRRDGKYSAMAGHDINYIAVSGVLSQLGRKSGPPSPPVNILGDFAGGGMMCAFGVIMALLSRSTTGKGQVVEANMVDGAAYLGTYLRLGLKSPMWGRPRGENMLDGGSPFYDVYETKDGKYMAVGALEPQFFAELMKGMQMDPTYSERRIDRACWPQMRQDFETKFKEKTRAEWEKVFDGTDACCTPVLEQWELENAGYEQRHAVTLKETPGVEMDQKQAWGLRGLRPGSGGEEVLQQWLGWKKGRDYEVSGGALASKAKSKL
jgi:alpha-methylacyl-CoA racemase